MAVLIDSPVWPWRGRRWSHLVSDVSYEELHAFAGTELGIPRRAFQGDHFDGDGNRLRFGSPLASGG